MRFRIKEKRKGSLSVKELLPDLAQEIKMVSLFEMETIHEKWEYITGSILATHSCPLKKCGSVLIVEADHSVFLNDIIMQKKIILSKIEEITMNNDIKDIRVEVKNHSLWRKK